jgi:hypothetical protein
MRPARVAAVETLSPHFRLADLEGEALRNVAWTAGQKVQVSMGSGLSARTYTPMSWDADSGRTRPSRMAMVPAADGQAACAKATPAGSSVRAARSIYPALKRRWSCSAMKPRSAWRRRSAIARRLTVQSICSRPRMSRSRGRCWRRSASATRRIERIADDAHLGAAEAEMLRLAASGAHFVLTGKASSIQRVSRALKAVGVVSSRVKTRAYWAQGKIGLD